MQPAFLALFLLFFFVFVSFLVRRIKITVGKSYESLEKSNMKDEFVARLSMKVCFFTAKRQRNSRIIVGKRYIDLNNIQKKIISLMVFIGFCYVVFLLFGSIGLFSCKQFQNKSIQSNKILMLMMNMLFSCSDYCFPFKFIRVWLKNWNHAGFDIFCYFFLSLFNQIYTLYGRSSFNSLNIILLSNITMELHNFVLHKFIVAKMVPWISFYD